MKPGVPGLFVLAWTGVTVAFEAGRWAYGWIVAPQLLLEWGTPLWWAESALYAALFSVGEAACQSRLLRRFGRAVPRWTAIVGGGQFAFTILYTMAHFIVLRTTGGVSMDGWTYQGVELSEHAMMALAGSLIMSTAVWGRRWEGPWMLWIAACVGLALAVGVAVAALRLAAYFGVMPAGPFVLQGMQAALRATGQGAGTAWLLWRFVLPGRTAVETA